MHVTTRVRLELREKPGSDPVVELLCDPRYAAQMEELLLSVQAVDADGGAPPEPQDLAYKPPSRAMPRRRA